MLSPAAEGRGSNSSELLLVCVGDADKPPLVLRKFKLFGSALFLVSQAERQEGGRLLVLLGEHKQFFMGFQCFLAKISAGNSICSKQV